MLANKTTNKNTEAIMQSENQDTNLDKSQSEYQESESEFNSLAAVESVYSVDSIDIVDSVNAHAVIFDAGAGAAAANETFTEAEVYSLDCARMAKHDRALERRSSKCRLTDRRQSARLTADGDIQPDRRAANRAANIMALRDGYQIRDIED